MHHAAPCCVHEGSLPAALLTVSFNGGLAAPTFLFIVYDLVRPMLLYLLLWQHACPTFCVVQLRLLCILSPL